MVISEADLSYAAGLFDGEGWIGINKNKGKVSPQHTLVCSVGMTDNQATDFLHNVFGGHYGKFKSSRAGHRDSYRWGITAQEAVLFLTAILPYLKVKRFQAWLGLEFMAQKTGTSRVAVSVEELALREGFHLALQNAKNLQGA